jgi:hypothetical protein
MCEGSVSKVDQTINVQVSQPIANATLGTMFNVSYSIQATKNIRKVMVLLGDQAVATFTYPSGITKSVVNTKSVTLVSTGFKNGNYMLKIVAFDFAGFSNTKEIPITLNKLTVAPSNGTGN